MTNSIVAQVRTFLDTMQAEQPEKVERATASARAHSKVTYGVELSLEEEAYLAIAVKFVAAVDGLSPLEFTGLRTLMERYGPPEEFIAFVEAFDVRALSYELIGELFEHGSDKAKRVLSGAIFVACLDGGREGMSDAERELSLNIATQLGLDPVLVEVYEARVHLDLYAITREDPELHEITTRLRHVLWKMG